MVHLRRGFILASLLAVASVLLPSIGAAQTARAVMEKLDANALRQDNSVFSIMKIATCKFGISGGKIRCTARATVKRLESASITTGLGGKIPEA